MNIFKKLIFATLLLVGSKTSFGQEISIRGGINLSQMLLTIDGEEAIANPRLIPGFLLGPVVEFQINNIISIESGLNYTTKGLKYIIDQTIEWKSLARMNIAYLDIPLSIKASLPFRDIIIFGKGGGYIAEVLFGDILTKQDINGVYGTWQKIVWGNQDDAFRRFDYGLSLGFGLKYKCIQLGCNYGIGLANIAGANRMHFKAHNRCAEFYFSYFLWKNGTKN